ncbi:MarR family winged helix-turn-helix transcriptional regulator [Kineosporia rhizophila]|uniref:MarR family winged helix-turn-helix transcriptional regulator n=1 Tax=Kineosporia rhizophila TaxID=84633 RepID=UPI000A5771AC|nr:MarR family winged helix-turn-helix transcriptional regulator [Kineosporia rhizophila]
MSAADPQHHPAATSEPDPGPSTDATARAYVTIEQELTVLIRRARGFSAQMSREFHPDLEPGAYAMLLWLDDVGSARMTEMAAYFGIGKPTVSRQLQLMEKLDLITREVDENDRRAQRLTLTENGATLVHQARAARRNSFKVKMAHWSQDDLDRFAGLLTQLNEDLSRPAG